MQEKTIKKFFEATNAIVISEMYLNEFLDNGEISIDNLKSYSSGHLGTSMSINFILANLYYFLNQSKLTSKIVVGTGHAGVSLMANLWLNGTLKKYYPNYSQDRIGLNNLIKDFGSTIRSEINPEYPETIYDGGELGYSLGVAYGYAIDTNTDIVPCIIGDGEAETGTITSAWQLAKTLNTKSKVLPIINLNGLKMSSPSFLSTLTDEELKNCFTSLGYQVTIVDSNDKSVTEAISDMQKALSNTKSLDHPLIIFKSLKGYTLEKYAGTIAVHKNPLASVSKVEKLKIISEMLKKYDSNIFDDNNQLLPVFNSFSTIPNKDELKPLTNSNNDVSPDEYLYELLASSNGRIFSPDEIYSNQFPNCAKLAIEYLNENLLLAIYQGYTMAGNLGYYISYEGFMPIVSSMITQYYKYLKQKQKASFTEIKYPLNFILTSTCWENTYSHQNPDFINTLFEKNDELYNVLYPKDKISAIGCIREFGKIKDKINVLTLSKRHDTIYSQNDTYQEIEIIKDIKDPDLVLVATGDYMLDIIIKAYNELTNNGKKIKVIYVTKPQILSTNNHDSLSDEEFTKYFDKDAPIIYLYCGYAHSIKSLLFDRNINCQVLGYNDEISVFGSIDNNTLSNKVSVYDIIKVCQNKIKRRVLRREESGK